MKKIITAFLVVLAVTALAQFSANAQEETTVSTETTTTAVSTETTTVSTETTTQPMVEPTKIYGDADSDGKITLKDILCIKKYIVKITSDISDMADVNVDSNINILDMLYIKKYLVNMNVVLGVPNPLKYNIKFTSVTYTSTQDSITLKWDTTGEYEYLLITDENDTELAKLDNTKSEYTFADLESKTAYTYKLVAGATYKEKVYSDEKTVSSVTMIEGKPETTVGGKSASEVTIKWKANDDYKNVEIYYSLKGKNDWKYSKTVSADLLTATVGGLDAGKRYDVKLRGEVLVNSQSSYSEFSTPHYGTTKPGNISGLKVDKKTATSISLSWNSAAAATKYQIYSTPSANSTTYTKVGETASLNYTINSLTFDTTYYYSIRSFVQIDGANYYGALTRISAKTLLNYITYKYGTSYQGRDLTAYIFNPTATKTIFIDFAVHGFEDEYYRDGKVLVDCGNKIVNYYKTHMSELNGRRLVVVPCANPDGTYAGTNNSRACSTAFGRCTANHVDMNRDFYSGGFNAKESRALRDLMIKYKPTYYINFHGWLNETLGDSTIGSIFRSTCNLSGNLDGIYAAGEGYIIGWAKNNLGAKACLVEFKSPSSVNYKDVISGLNKLAKK